MPEGSRELHEVFLHAEWEADQDETIPGATEGRDDIQADVEAAQEEQGHASYTEGLFNLARMQKNLPLPAWQIESEDASFSTQLQRGLLGGGAARAHALLRPAWWMEVSPAGTLALVRDSGLSILSSADEFSNPRFEWDSPTEMAGPMGRWRRVAWSVDASVLAVSDALGTAILLSGSNGRPIARIQSLLPTAAPAVDLCFLGSETSKTSTVTHVLLALSYEGVLYRHPFTIPFRSGITATEVPPLDLSAHHAQVSCMAIHHDSKLLAFGGWDSVASASLPSISLWKATEEAPYYDLVHTMGASRAKGSTAPGMLSRIVTAVSLRGRQQLDSMVLKLVFSPAGKHLAVLQVSGAITVLSCGAKTVTASHSAASLRTAEGGREGWESSVADVAFWNEESLILSRRNGRVTIMPIRGEGAAESPDVGRFHFAPCVTSGSSGEEGGSLVLECRRRETDGLRGERAGEAFTAGRRAGEGDAVVSWWWRLVFGGGSADVGTGPRFIRRYRLLSVCKTTVERLLQRRLERGDYEAALKVAGEHGLDTDHVHKQEWEASAVSGASVDSILPKITDLGWVLEQCCSRWPNSKAAAKALTEYGLDRCRSALADASELDESGRAAELRGKEVALSARLDRITVAQMLDPSDLIDAARLHWFCESELDEVAAVMAAEEDCAGLRVLVDKYRTELTPCWLRVLSAIPESCRASKYAAVLPTDMSDKCVEGGVLVEGGGVAEWYVSRATEIEQRAGLVDNALDLLMQADGRVRGLEGLKSGRGARTEGGGGLEGAVGAIWRLVSELRQAATLVYECGVDVTVADLQRMSSMERLRAMCLRDQASLVHDLREVALPLLSSVSSAEAQALVSGLVLSLARDQLDLCAQVFEASRHTEPLFVFTSCPLGGKWLQNAPAHFVEWAAAPPDSVRGRVGEEVKVVAFEPQGPGAKAQAEAAASAGEEEQVVVVMVKGLEEQKTAIQGGRPSADGSVEGALLGASVCVVLGTPAQIKSHSSNAVARITRQRILHDPVAMVDLALRCVYQCNSIDFLPAMNTIYQSLPERSAKLGRVEDEAKYEELQKRADDLDKHLTAIEMLQKYGQAKPLSFFLSAHEHPDAALAILRAMSRSKVRQQEQKERAWVALEDDIAWLGEQVFPFLQQSACTNVYIEALLHANMFRLARSIIEREKEKVAEGSAAFGKYVTTVLAVARENLDSASSCDDAAWQNAKSILAMIPSDRDEEDGDDDDEEEEVSEDVMEARRATKAARAVWGAEADRERDLMEAIQMLQDLKVGLLPIQVRQEQDKMKIVERVVREQPSALRESDRVLLLGQRLGLAAPAEQHAVREFLARAMLSGQTAEGVLQSEGEAEVSQLMKVGRASIWDLAWQLAQTEAVAVEQRMRLAGYAMTHCPAKELETVRRGWKELGRVKRLGQQLCAAADQGRWAAVSTWTNEDESEAVEEGGPWAGRRRGAVMLHPFYHTEMPGGKSNVGVLNDPYVYRSGSDEEIDLQALAVEETVAEGLEIMAHIVTKAENTTSSVEPATSKSGKKEREGEKEREGRLRRRLAASLGQSDSHLQLMAMLAGSPVELLAGVRALCRSCFQAAGDGGGAGVKGADEKLRAGLEGAVELASAVCGVMMHAAEGGDLPLVLSSEWWGTQLEQARQTVAKGDRKPLRQLLSEAETGGTDVAAWRRVGLYLQELARCLKEHCTVGMPWTFQAVCDASVDVSVLLRTAVAAGTAAGKKGAMDEVAQGADRLRGALPGEDSLSAEGVKACVVGGELQAAWKKGGGVVSGGLEKWLELLSPLQRALVAQDLVRSSETAAALSVLATVRTELCDGPEERTRTEEKVRALRLQADAESARGLQADMAGVRARLEAAGIKKVPELSASVGELSRFVEAAAERATAEGLTALAMLTCLWDPALAPWLHLLSGGAIGKATAGSEYGGDGSIQGDALNDAEAVIGATARCWAVLMRHVLRLQLWTVAVALRKGPARYSLTMAEEGEMVEAAAGGGELLSAHLCVLSPRDEMRQRGLDKARAGTWAGGEGGEEAEDLLESCVRVGLAGALETAPLLWERPPLLEASFPSSSTGRAGGSLEEEGWQGSESDGAVPRLERGPYLVVKDGGAVSTAVTSRRAEVLPLAVCGMCEEQLALRAGALILTCTDTHPLLRTRRCALVALQAYLLRRSGEREQRQEGSRQLDAGGVREGVRERCRVSLRRLEQHFSASA